MVSVSDSNSFLRFTNKLLTLSTPKLRYNTIHAVLKNLENGINTIEATDSEKLAMADSLKKVQEAYANLKAAFEELPPNRDAKPATSSKPKPLAKKSIPLQPSTAKSESAAQTKPAVLPDVKQIEPQEKKQEPTVAPVAAKIKEDRMPNKNLGPSMTKRVSDAMADRLQSAKQGIQRELPILKQRCERIGKGIGIGLQFANRQLIQPVKGFLQIQANAALNGPFTQELREELSLAKQEFVKELKGYLPFTSEPALSNQGNQAVISGIKLFSKTALATLPVLGTSSLISRMSSTASLHPYAFAGLTIAGALGMGTCEFLKSSNKAAQMIEPGNPLPQEDLSQEVDAFITSENPSAQLMSRLFASEKAVGQIVEKTDEQFLRKNMYFVLPYIQNTDLFVSFYGSCHLKPDEKFDLYKKCAVLNPSLLETIFDEKYLTLDRLSEDEMIELYLHNPSLMEKLGLNFEWIRDAFNDEVPFSFVTEQALFHPELVDRLIEEACHTKKDGCGYTLLDHAGHTLKDIPSHTRVKMYAKLFNATPMSREEKSSRLSRLDIRFLCALTNYGFEANEILPSDQAEIWNRAEEGDIGMLKEAGFDPNVRDEQGSRLSTI